MIVETYRKVTKGPHPEMISSHKKDAQERKRLLSDFGFKNVKKLDKAAETSDEASIFYEKISKYDLKIWEVFLPTKYYYKPRHWGGGRDFSFGDYRFDKIPTEVLKELEFAQSLKLFDNFVIMTPEEKDPLLAGVVTSPNEDNFFIISRWGESLISFEILKKAYESCWHDPRCHRLATMWNKAKKILSKRSKK